MSGVEQPHRLPFEILIDEPLHRYTVARLGGKADVVVQVNNYHVLGRPLELCLKHKLPYRIIGGGANILISDDGFRGVVIVNNAKGLILREEVVRESGMVMVASGHNLISLARETMELGLSGLEWAISVPGTVGGAVVNNAGAHGGDISTILVNVALEPEQRLWTKDQMNYRYRESALKHASFPFVVTMATFQLNPGHDPAQLRAKADEYAAHRKKTQPPGASLGSMFKNPAGDYAGRLIEAAGLKGHRIGGVTISPVHANFFVNIGGGTAHDYLELIQLAQREVLAKFGVALELEVEMIGM